MNTEENKTPAIHVDIIDSSEQGKQTVAEQEAVSHRHHSHHHHHHRKKKKTTGKEAIKRFFKKNRVTITVAIGLLAVCLLAFAVAVEQGVVSLQQDPQSTVGQVEENDRFIGKDNYLYVGTPTIQSPVSLIGEAAKAYMAADISVVVGDIWEAYKSTEVRMDVGKPVDFAFDLPNLSSKQSVASAQLEITEGDDFADSVFYTMENYKVSVYNLKTGTQYSYRAIFTLSDGTIVTHGGSFTTAEGPRILTVDGIYNVRDVGGWKTTNGLTVKQGLLYRGTELDSAVEDRYLLTQEGINELVLNLGIKTDMDLRSPEDRMPGRYILGTNVEHKYYNALMYEQVFTGEGAAAMRDIFKDLAEPKNYPIYLHCTYGCDRTGTACYILGALLGVSENDLIKDYELSGLFTDTIDRENIKKVYTGLQSYSGFTLQEKAESYLLSIGVTEDEIYSIKTIFLG